MNKTFNDRDFWQLYSTLEAFQYEEGKNGEKKMPNEVTESAIEKHFEELKKDFKFVAEDYETTFEGKTYKGTTKSIHFIFIAGALDFLIEYFPDVRGCEINLFLYHNDEEYLLGWRDCARWHPYCLKYDELLLILAQIEQHDKEWKGSKIPLLLLKDFVGFGDADEADRIALSQQAEAILNDLNIENNEDFASCLQIPEYAWIKTELGLEFMGEYSCYSLRNAPHKDSKEGKFPFKLWQELMKKIS